MAYLLNEKDREWIDAECKKFREILSRVHPEVLEELNNYDPEFLPKMIDERVDEYRICLTEKFQNDMQQLWYGSTQDEIPVGLLASDETEFPKLP